MRKKVKMQLGIVVLLLVCLVALAGCGPKDDVTDPADNNNTQQTDPNDNQGTDVTDPTDNNDAGDPNAEADAAKADFELAINGFTMAYFNYDLTALASFLVEGVEAKAYSDTDVFDSVTDTKIIYDEAALATNDTMTAQYEFRINDEDSLNYLNLELTKADGQWLVSSYALEK